MALRPRSLAFVGVVVLAVVGLIATVAVNAVRQGGGDGRIVWWVPDWDHPTAVELVRTFEQQHPGATVELVQTTGGTVATKTAVALNSGNTPDVITESVARVPGYVAKGQLADLSALYGPDLPRDDFAPGLLDAVGRDGATYAVPYRWGTNGLIYNPDLFAAAGIDGPPATWAEFEADAKRLTAGDVAGTAWPTKGDPSDLTLRFVDFALSDGATVVRGIPRLTEDSAAGAVDMIGRSIREGWATPSSFELDNTGIRELFLQGRVAMYFGGVFDVDAAAAKGAPIATAPLPGPTGVGTAQGVGWSHLVPAAAPNPDGARALVAFLGRAENQAALTLTFPARLSATTASRFQTPLRRPFATQLTEHSVPAASDPRWTAIVQYVHDQIEADALGRVPAGESAANIVRRAEEVLAR